jgi:hypothetical protein
VEPADRDQGDDHPLVSDRRLVGAEPGGLCRRPGSPAETVASQPDPLAHMSSNASAACPSPRRWRDRLR